ncbi:hypothetical protein DICA3_F09098 [Diutina catenulata]
MQQCLASNNVMQALKHVSNLVNELRTSALAPKSYYEVYMAVFDALEILGSYLLAQQQQHPKKPLLDQLYELVQYAANIVPRLYMMVAVGTTYMRVEGAPITDLMKDLIEMCKGVQHPTRGLFLRYYLGQRTKNWLPVATEPEFRATIEFLVANFIEMNKLWVRLQHQGHSSERDQRLAERDQLKILVGSQLVRISQVIDEFQGDSYSAIEYYRDSVFPIVTSQIVACRDSLAQSYLVDVLIQIFPDEFHFATLDQFLGLILQVHPSLTKGDLVSSLVERFVKYQDEKRAEREEKEKKDEVEKGEKNEKGENEKGENEKGESEKDVVEKGEKNEKIEKDEKNEKGEKADKAEDKDEKTQKTDKTQAEETGEKETGTEETKEATKADAEDKPESQEVEPKPESLESESKPETADQTAKAASESATKDVSQKDEAESKSKDEVESEVSAESKPKDQAEPKDSTETDPSKPHDPTHPSTELKDSSELSNSPKPTESPKNSDLPPSDLSHDLSQLTLTADLSDQLFDVFWDFYQQLYQSDPEMPASEHSRILGSIIQVALAFDVDAKHHAANLNKVYEFAARHLSAAQSVELLVAPLQVAPSVAALAEMTFQYALFEQLDPPNQKRVAVAVAEKVIALGEPLASTALLDAVFQYLGPLVADRDDHTTASDLGVVPTVRLVDGHEVSAQFMAGQRYLSKLINLVGGASPLEVAANLHYVRRMWLNRSKPNLVFTYPTLVARLLFELEVYGHAVKAAMVKGKAAMVKGKKTATAKKPSPAASLPAGPRASLTNQFKQVSVILNELYQLHPEHSVATLQLYLDAAAVADNCGLGSASVEFVHQAVVVYEETLVMGTVGNYYGQVSPHDALGGSSAPSMALTAIVNAATACRSWDRDDRASVAAQLTQYATRLLRKQDQCRAVYGCGHLWWSPQQPQHAARVAECLQKAVRVADSCMDPYLSLKLFIEVLNRALVFAVYGNPSVDARFINGLLALVRTNIDTLRADALNTSSSDNEAVLFRISQRIFSRTCDYIVAQQDEERLQGVMV